MSRNKMEELQNTRTFYEKELKELQLHIKLVRQKLKAINLILEEHDNGQITIDQQS